MATEGILSDQAYGELQFFNALSGFALSMLGIPTNLLSIRTFLSMGLDDGVTVSFLSLSISDLVSSILNLANCGSLAMHAYEYFSGNLLCYYDPLFFTIIFCNLCFMTYTITVLNTMYLAITRCMCVVMPLRFRNIFSAKKSFIVAIVCALVPIACAAPIFFKIHLKPYEGNSSTLDCPRQVLTFPDDREEVKDVSYIINLATIPFTSQIIVLVCMILMVHILDKSKYVKRSIRKASGNHSDSDGNDDTEDLSSDNSEFRQRSDNENNENDSTWRKDIKVVRFEKTLREQQRSVKSPRRCQTCPVLNADKTVTRDNDAMSFTTKLKHTILRLKNPSSPDLRKMDTTDGCAVVISSNKQLFQQKTTNTSAMRETKARKDDALASAPLSHKESRMIQQVVLICAIFFLCNLPMIGMGIASIAVPEMDATFGKHTYVRMYYFLHFFRRVIEQFSSSINFFIYMKYNSKFRHLTKRFIKKMALVKLVRGKDVGESSDYLSSTSCSKV